VPHEKIATGKSERRAGQGWKHGGLWWTGCGASLLNRGRAPKEAPKANRPQNSRTLEEAEKNRSGASDRAGGRKKGDGKWGARAAAVFAERPEGRENAGERTQRHEY